MRGAHAGWAFELHSGEPIDFRKGGNGIRYIVKGWSGQENWGTWTDGGKASLKLPFAVAALPAGQDLELTIEASAFGNPKHPRQTVRVIVNDEDMGDFSLEVADGRELIGREDPETDGGQAVSGRRRPGPGRCDFARGAGHFL